MSSRITASYYLLIALPIVIVGVIAFFWVPILWILILLLPLLALGIYDRLQKRHTILRTISRR